jgi:Family of unknown function (DUF5313)
VPEPLPELVPVRPTVRPGPWQWIRYVAGRELPERYRPWVVWDTVGPTWVWRHLGRLMAIMALLIVPLAVFLPIPIGLKLGALAGATIMGLIYGFAYIDESTDMRLTRAGYPTGLGQQVRRERAESAQREQSARRRAKTEQRRGQRLSH